MPIPVTKIFLSTATSSATGGYRLLPNASGDLNLTVTGDPVAPWVAGVGDMNGDGIAEVIVGGPGDDDKDIDAGRIYVRFGTATGGTATVLPDSVNGVIIDGLNAGDHAGAAVGGISDLNADGRADILVGAPGMENGALTDAGAAFVLWGKASGGIDLGDPAVGDGGGYIMKGQAAGDMAGAALTAVADLNGDGKADVLVGAAGNDAGGLDAGAAYLVFGKGTASAVNLSSVAGGTGGFRIIGEAEGDRAGYALSTLGDLNGDGKAELLIGAPDNEAGGNHAGAVYVVYGKSTGTQVNLDDVAAGVGGFRITGSVDENAGAAVTGLGDINGDGLSDILIGTQGSGGTPGSTNLYVVYGKNDTNEVLLSDVALGTGGFRITPQAGQDVSEMSLAMGGDFNRDGIADLIIGTPNDEEGGSDAGAVYVAWGGNGAIDLGLISQGIGGAKIVGVAGSRTGSSVAMLPDVNGDATPDLLIGSAGAANEFASVVYAPLSWQPDFNIYGTNGADVIGFGYGGTHTVGDGNDTVLGLGGNDSIVTGIGDDSLEGGTGADTLVGGQGNDSYLVDSALDVVNEAVGEGSDTVTASANWTMTGGSEIELLQLTGAAHVGTGNALNNSIVGGSGADTLDGGTGVDTLAGGGGNDRYVVDDALDVIQEGNGAGTDIVAASVDWTLGDNLEALQLTGAAHQGTGNVGDNSITGGAGDDTLDGAAGNDTLSGGGGNDTYAVDSSTDVVQEAIGGGTDTVLASANFTLGLNVENLQLLGAAHQGTGNVGDNSITGGAGDDTLAGGGGNDTLAGGGGNDSYTVDSALDVIQENAGGGNDTVVASFDYTLTGEIENLQLTGTAHVGTGSSTDNSITGGTGNDTLDGAAGNDTMAGGAGDDTYHVDSVLDVVQEGVGAGTDTVIASVDYTLGDNVENMQLTGTAHTGTGNAGDNSITGGADSDTLVGADGADTLNGGAGADSMVGGAGDDEYYVDNLGDIVVEDAAGGNDTVVTSIDNWTIGSNIESVRLTGAAHQITGNALANTLSGGDDDDTIDGAEGDDLELGGDGDDVLISHSGLDSLSGGSGDDRYEVKGGHVEIEDFLGDDTIDASEAEGDSYIDLSGDDISHIENEDSHLGNGGGGGGGSSFAPLDVQFLQDLSGSFGDDIANVRTLVPQIVSALQTVQTDSMFGASTFVDKAVSPFGTTGEWVYQTMQPLTASAATLTATYNSMVIRNGVDEPEAQIEALMQLALHPGEVGYRPDSARFVVLFTDAPYHSAGDGAAGGITTPNNGDAIMDGTPAGTGEDYPLIAQVKAAVEAANIIPIFAIAGGYQSNYQTLVTELGRGTVVTLTSDSSNVVAALTAGLAAATVTHIENAWGGAGDDTIKGSDDDNSLLGNDGDDSVTGGEGDDSVTGGGGDDTAVFSGNRADYTVTTVAGVTTVHDDNAADGDDGADVLESIEHLEFADLTEDLAVIIDGTPGADSIIGGATNDVISGFAGNDRLFGGLGDDQLNGGDGRDRLEGDGGNDTIDGGIGDDTLRGGDGDDSLLGGSGNDTVYGGIGNDYINGGNSDDFLQGEGGNDTIYGGSAIDLIRGGDGDDVGYGESGADDLRMGLGNDTLNGGSGQDKLYGNEGADMFVFDVQAFNAVDRIKDFSALDGDTIQLDSILIGFDPLTSVITDYAQFATGLAGSYLSIDRDGAGATYSFERIAVVENVPGLDAQTFYDAGSLLIV